MKTKRAGREMNPTDAYRKEARKRENKRNKAERTWIRESFGKAHNTNKITELRNELEELIRLEQTSELNRLQKLRKKIVQEAYEVAVRKKKEEELKKQQAEEEGKQLHAGLPNVPLPKPPPLPAGPQPGGQGWATGPALPPPPMPPPLPAGPVPAAAAASSSAAGAPALLPPPPGPPPSLEAAAAAAAASNVPVLPPPPGPPPPAAAAQPLPPFGPLPGAVGGAGMLPPPSGPPPGAGMLPPPAMPPPVSSILPPPVMPPPGTLGSSILPPPAMPPPAAAAAAAVGSKAAGAAGSSSSKAAGSSAPTITGASTVTKRPVAHKDKALTSMVPASVLVKREAGAKAAAGAGDEEELRIGPGFGLAPMQKPAVGPNGRVQQQKQLVPPPQLGRWGNAVTVVSLPAGSSAAGKGAAGKAGGSSAAVAAGAAAAAGPKTDDALSEFMNSLKDLGAFE